MLQHGLVDVSRAEGRNYNILAVLNSIARFGQNFFCQFFLHDSRFFDGQLLMFFGLFLVEHL